MIDNDDPIKEYKPFRLGIDNLTESNEINSNDYYEVSEYNNLHECSDDLSDRGSRLEEIAHAKYAEAKRKLKANETYQSNTNSNTNSTQNVNTKMITYIIVFMFIIIPVMEFLAGILGLVIKGIGEISKENTVTYDSGYYDFFEL